ncbi:MAG: hypothetical protein AABX72_04555 [Nanoarchaeota archaeon]
MKLLVLLLALLMLVPLVSAHCPLCTGAIGIAATTAGYYGVDASIIGLFVGAFGISTGLWIGRKVKQQYLPGQLSLIVSLSFVLTIIPFFFMTGEQFMFPLSLGSFKRIFFFDKLIFGSFLGGMVTVPTFWLHEFIKKIRGKVLFPFQGIAFTLTMLAVNALILFFVFRS